MSFVVTPPAKSVIYYNLQQSQREREQRKVEPLEAREVREPVLQPKRVQTASRYDSFTALNGFGAAKPHISLSP